MSIINYLKNKELIDKFTSKNEYIIKGDKHDRVLYRYINNKDIFIPTVSNYITKNKSLDYDWPENHKFAVCLTHDIDSIYPSWRYNFFTAFQYATRMQYKKSLERISNRFNKKNNPYLNFKYIIDLENEYNAVSSFYFKVTNDDPDGWIYNIQDLKYELGMILDRHCEIGLHGGYYSYNDLSRLKIERNTLENLIDKTINGIRMHYLRFKIPYTWRLIYQLGLKYDTTFGYSDMPGFRNGMSQPFKPYDLYDNKEINLIEIPLNIMDISLNVIEKDKLWNAILNIISSVENNKGVLTLLWHNNTFDEIYNYNYAKLYVKILNELYKRNAWMTTCFNVSQFWSKYVIKENMN